MITISLAYAGVDEGFRLRFPSSSTENSRTLLEVLYQNPRVDKIEISEVSSNVYNLGGYLKKVDIWNPDNQEKLETLGRTLQTMDRDIGLLIIAIIGNQLIAICQITLTSSLTPIVK